MANTVNAAGSKQNNGWTNPVSKRDPSKLSKGQIIDKIQDGLARFHGSFFSTKSKVEIYNEITKRLSELPKEELMRKLEELEGRNIDEGAQKTKKLASDLSKVKKEYESTRDLYLKEKNKFNKNMDSLDKFSAKYFKKSFEEISDETWAADSLVAAGGKLSILNKALSAYHVGLTPVNKKEIESARKCAGDADKSITSLGNYRAKLDSLQKDIHKLEENIKHEIINLIESGEYRKTTPEETLKALEKVKAADPLEDIRKIHEKGFTGKGVSIVIIDSGIHPHPDFKGRVTVFKDFVSGKNGVENAYDDHRRGHGTHVAGITAGSGQVSGGRFKGVAPDANIIVLKVLDKFRHINTDDFRSALEWIADNKERYNIKVVNTSVGDYENVAWNLFFKKEVDDVLDKGIVWVSSAGNNGMGNESLSYPANEGRIISVGSLDQLYTLSDKDDMVSTFSSWGEESWSNSKPNLTAPGSNIAAPLALNGNGNKDSFIDVNSDGKDDYVYMSGTSMAAPYVAGLAALLLQANPDLTSNDIRYILMDTADPIKGVPPFIQGSGVVNPEKALQRAFYLKKLEK